MRACLCRVPSPARSPFSPTRSGALRPRGGGNFMSRPPPGLPVFSPGPLHSLYYSARASAQLLYSVHVRAILRPAGGRQRSRAERDAAGGGGGAHTGKCWARAHAALPLPASCSPK